MVTKTALTMLKEDHDRIKEMLKELETGESEGQDRTALFDDVREALTVHEMVEEDVFYPALKEALSGKDQKILYEAFEEHDIVDKVLKDLEQEDPDSDAFAAKAKVLREMVEHHVEEEETEMFKAAREHMDQSQLRDLGESMRQHERWNWT